MVIMFGVRKLDSNNFINNNQLSIELKNRLLQALESSKPSISINIENNQKVIDNIGETEATKIIKEHEQIEDIEEMKQLFNRINLELKRLNQLFWTKEELEELQFAVDFFEARIQNMIQATLRNLEWYQNEGWKKFLNKEDELQ